MTNSYASDEAYNEAYDAGFAQGRSEATRDERKRLSAIFASPDAISRFAAAKVFAFETDLPADAAIDLLATLPKAEPAGVGPRSKNAHGGLVLNEGDDVVDDFERGKAAARGQQS